MGLFIERYNEMWLVIVVYIIVIYFAIALDKQRPLESIGEYIIRKNRTAKLRVVCGSLLLGVCIVFSVAAVLSDSLRVGVSLFLAGLPVFLILIHSGSVDRSDYIEFTNRSKKSSNKYAVLNEQKEVLMYVQAAKESDALDFALTKFGQFAKVHIELCDENNIASEKEIAKPQPQVQAQAVEDDQKFDQSEKYAMLTPEKNYEPWTCPMCGAKGNTGMECKTCRTTNFDQARRVWESSERIRKEQEERLELIKSKYLYGIFDDNDKKIMQLRASNEAEALTLAQTHLGASSRIYARIMATLNKPGKVNLFAVYDTNGRILMYLREESISDARSFAVAKLWHENFRIEVAESVK